MTLLSHFHITLPLTAAQSYLLVAGTFLVAVVEWTWIIRDMLKKAGRI
jgi:hypothetical protein